MSQSGRAEFDEFINFVGKDWKEEILEYLRKEQDDSEEVSECEETKREKYFAMLDAIRECMMDEDQLTLQYIKDKFESETAIYNQLIKYVKETLRSFDESRELRNSQNNRKIWNQLIDYIYDNVILRYDPDFADNYQEYHLSGRDEMIECAMSLEVITNMAVEKAYTRRAIEKLCWKLFRLNEDSCRYIAEKIDVNLRSIREKMILDALLDK